MAGQAGNRACSGRSAPPPRARCLPARRLPQDRVISAGVDLVDLPRLDRAASRSGEAFLRRVLTDTERDLLGARPDPRGFGAIFGAKECVVKVLRGLPPYTSLRDIEVHDVPRNRESVRVGLHGGVRDWARARGIGIHLSTAPVSDDVLLTWAVATPGVSA